MRKLILLGLFLLLIPFALSAQNIRVTGTVLDADNSPLPGVNVIQAGTTNGTITDLDGKYEINVPSDATLMFSYIGFLNQEIAVDGRTSLPPITLKSDDKEIDEVVVVGYGTQKKSDLTGSVASVKGEDLMNRSTTDAAAALQGKAAGIQILNSSGKPGQGAQIRVRGYSSNAEQIGPLLIVDGLPVSSIQYLDPSMIESMEVLKDAASAAIYGAQAGNGVILITTKSGKKGQGTVTYDAKFTNQRLGHVPEFLSASEFKDWMSMQLGAEAVNNDMADATSKYGWDSNTDTDWMDEYFENTWAQQHTLSLSGGNDRGSYFASIGYVNQDGIVKGNKDKYERLTAQINADYKVKDWLKIGTNTGIEKWKSKGVSENGYGSAFEMLLLIDPLTPVYWTDEKQMLDDYKPHYEAVKAGTEKYTLFGDENGYYATSYFNPRLAGGNPFSQRDRAMEKKDGVNVNGSAYVNITPIKQITYTSRLGYRISYNNTSDYEFPYYLNGQTKGDNYKISGISQNGLWYQWENFVNYNQTFAEKHNVGAMIGMSFRENNTNEVNAKAEGSDILKDYADNFIYLSSVNAKDDTKKTITGTPNTERAISYFGRLTYNYDNRYSLQTNFRADAFDASKLAEGNRWGKFFSASAGWTFSNESFFKDNIDESIMSFGKIRASWGQNGNVNVLNNYKYAASLNVNGLFYNMDETNKGYYGSMPNGLPSPELTWEKSEQIDLGADFRFLRDRLTVGLDWYKKTTKDLLVDAPTMPESGVSSKTINAGEIENRGFEMELTWKDKIGDFNYSVSGNMATLHNEATYLDESIQRIKGGDVSGSNQVMACYFEKGEPLWYMRGYKYAGIASDGKAQYYDKDGNITTEPNTEDMTNVGSGLPKLTYGITLNAEYKGFDLTIFGAGAAGNDIYYGLYRTGYNNIAKGIYEDFKDGKYPAADKIQGDNHFWSSSAMVFSGAYFKIKQIQLGYTLPKHLVQKAFMQNVRAYISLDDFFTFTKYPGLDPETCTASYNCPGLDKGAYPNMKKVVLGFTVTF
ncbi:MAG: TonB-dependent receptor [Bacteroidales bacterium]|nr:TonB-dependent receptor [Bacteroidales bacterium]